MIQRPRRLPWNPCTANINDERARRLQNSPKLLSKRFEPIHVIMAFYIPVILLPNKTKGGLVTIRSTEFDLTPPKKSRESPSTISPYRVLWNMLIEFKRYITEPAEPIQPVFLRTLKPMPAVCPHTISAFQDLVQKLSVISQLNEPRTLQRRHPIEPNECRPY